MNAPTDEQETGKSRTAHRAAGSPTLHPVGFEQRLLDRARLFGLKKEDRLVIGFSGGRDSLALAGAMRWVKRRLGVRPTLVHVDHGLRPASEDEARIGAALADNLGLPFEHHRLAAPPREVHRGVGLEEAARRERYHLLFAAATRLQARAIVTAHHRQDQAETVLLHLLRGGGVRGARAMAEISSVPLHDRDAHDISQETPEPCLWRPLLHASPSEIDRYVRYLGLTPIADQSNDDLTLRRNAIRHRVLPLLEEVAPGAMEALARYAALATEDDALLATLCDSAISDAMRTDGGLDALSLIDQPMAMKRRMVRKWLDMTTAFQPITMNRTDEVIALAGRNVGGNSVEIGGGWTVQLTRGMLHANRVSQGETGWGISDGDC